MSFTDEEESDPEWKEYRMKTSKLVKKEEQHEEQDDANKPKYSQKFCDKWLQIFDPWLTKCEDDVNKPFCRACQCRLDCNRCHLQRHERTTKHARNLEILLKKGEGAARQNLSIRQERSKYYQQRKKQNSSLASSHEASDLGMDTATDDFIEEYDAAVPVGKTEPAAGARSSFQFVQTEADRGGQYSEDNLMKQEAISADGQIDPLPTPPTTGAVARRSATGKVHGNTGRSHAKKGITATAGGAPVIKKERMKLFMQIQKDKNDLMDSFKELMGSGGCGGTLLPSPPREKNHVDLFFESVSSSVKALTPKLIAETKMRVSQLICELELRALTENDHLNASTDTSPSNGGGTMGVVVSTQAGGGAAIGNTTYVISQPVAAMVHAPATGLTHVESAQHYQTLS